MKTSSKIAFIIAWFIAMIISFVILAEVTHAKEFGKVDLKILTPIVISKNIDEDCYHKKVNMLGCLVEFKDNEGKITSRKKYIKESTSPFESKRVPLHENWHEVESILGITDDDVRIGLNLPKEWPEPKEFSANMYAYWEMSNRKGIVEIWYGDYFRNKIK